MVGKASRKGALVMIIAVPGGVVLPAHVDYSVARLELGGISAAHERRRSIRGEKTQQVDGESFIGVEVPTSSNQ